MRNLKKLLSLVLVLVLAMSMTTVASAKTLGEYTDADSVSAEYAVAVDVATQLGILQGMTEETYGPQGTLTRAQLATMIYRITTGDVAGKYVANYAEGAAAQFSDVPATHWAAGYIAYCADAGYLKGMGNGTYSPESKLTGYQALAALLRAIGYNQAGQFTGADWTVQVAEIAYSGTILEGVYVNLNGAITREVAAQLVFNALFANKVFYTNAYGYQKTVNTLAYSVFDIVTEKAGEANETIDTWGRPGTVWYDVYGDMAVVIADAPVASYTVAVTECKVSTDVGIKTSKAYYTFTNGVLAADKYTVNATDTVTVIGAQGRQTEVYADRIVYVDTYLAKVTAAIPAAYDAAGHVKNYAMNDLSVYMSATPSNFRIYGTYAVNDFVLVNVNAATGKAVALGKAEAETAKQTYVWWNADKHTVNSTNYMDACQFHLDQAGIDLTANHTWFFDQFNNLIGVVDVAATPKTYAIVENVQWLNTWGVNGYAQANIRYMDNTTATVTVKDVTTFAGVKSTMTYADYTEINKAGGDDFKAGKISTVWQYNDDCMKDLYEVIENIDGTISLVEQAEVAGADVKDGISAVTDGTNVKFYTDNYTVYMIQTLNPVTGAYTYTMVTGYDALENSWTGADVEVDYVLNSALAGGYAKYVYITGTADKAAVVSTNELVYFTSNTRYYGDALLNNVPCFVVTGVVDAEGNTDALYIAKDSNKSDLENTVAMYNFLTAAQDKLYLVKTTGGIVASLADMTEAVDGTVLNNVYDIAFVDYAAAGTFATIDGNGVLKVFTDATKATVSAAYNVNATTTIINNGGVGTVTDLNNAVLAGKAVYVVGAYNALGQQTTQAVTIFIAPAPVAPEKEPAFEGAWVEFDGDTVPGTVAVNYVGTKPTTVEAVLMIEAAIKEAGYEITKKEYTSGNYVWHVKETATGFDMGTVTYGNAPVENVVYTGVTITNSDAKITSVIIDGTNEVVEAGTPVVKGTKLRISITGGEVLSTLKVNGKNWYIDIRNNNVTFANPYNGETLEIVAK